MSLLVYWFNRDFFQRDFQLIRQLGISNSRKEFHVEVDTFTYQEKARGGYFRQVIKIRLSGKRLLALERWVAAWET